MFIRWALKRDEPLFKSGLVKAGIVFNVEKSSLTERSIRRKTEPLQDGRFHKSNLEESVEKSSID